jgi:hypothetical protein
MCAILLAIIAEGFIALPILLGIGALLLLPFIILLLAIVPPPRGMSK